LSRKGGLIIGLGEADVVGILNNLDLRIRFFKGCHAWVVLAVIDNDDFEGYFLQCSVNRFQAIF
jgi:hypothetical protein